MIFDTHAHYDDEAFDGDRDGLSQRLQEENIAYVVNVGASIKTSQNTIELTEKHPFFYGAIGVHPQEAAELNEEKMKWLTEKSALEKIVAIGEIGLDYYWNEPERELQKKWFRRQIQLAREVKLPIIIHSRDAAKDTMDILKAEKAEELSGVIHCFSYSREIARDYLNMQYYFGIGGVITFQNAKKLKEAVEYIPLEYLLLETDCPYLAPIPHRGKRNDSTNLVYVVEAIASIKGISEEEVATKTYENAKRFYGIL